MSMKICCPCNAITIDLPKETTSHIETTQYCPYNAITIDLPKETTSHIETTQYCPYNAITYYRPP